MKEYSLFEIVNCVRFLLNLVIHPLNFDVLFLFSQKEEPKPMVILVFLIFSLVFKENKEPIRFKQVLVSMLSVGSGTEIGCEEFKEKMADRIIGFPVENCEKLFSYLTKRKPAVPVSDFVESIRELAGEFDAPEPNEEGLGSLVEFYRVLEQEMGNLGFQMKFHGLMKLIRELEEKKSHATVLVFIFKSFGRLVDFPVAVLKERLESILPRPQEEK